MGSHGFAQADILSQWNAIAGDRLAGLCKPERIKWPRAGEQRGGTMILQATQGRALDVQYAIPALKERVNQFFGYEAITAIKVVQGHDLSKTVPVPPQNSRVDDTILADLSNISDPELKAALARLSQSLKRSPQR